MRCVWWPLDLASMESFIAGVLLERLVCVGHLCVISYGPASCAHQTQRSYVCIAIANVAYDEHHFLPFVFIATFVDAFNGISTEPKIKPIAILGPENSRKLARTKIVIHSVAIFCIRGAR